MSMAVDIKKMVDAICSLTVLELSKLVKALRDKFGLESTKPEKKSKPVPDPAPIEPSDEPIDESEDTKADKVSDGSTGIEQEPSESEEESKLVPDPLSVEVANVEDEAVDQSIEDAEAETVMEGSTEVAEQRFNPDFNDYDSNWAPANQKPNNRPNPPPPKPKGENYYLVYAWRWSNDERYAKVGRSSKHRFKNRLITTYHPTDDPYVIGYRKCKNLQHAEDLQNHILQGLKRTRPDREWVEIDEAFEEMINLSFIKGEPE